MTNSAASQRRLPAVLQVGALPADAIARLAECFPVYMASEADHAIGDLDLETVGGIATNGKSTVGADLLNRLPGLRIISCLGAGTEGIDVAAVAARGVSIATTAAVLAGDVADVAIGLMIAAARDLVGAASHAREGRWRQAKYPLGRSLGGARIGIFGLGNIGRAVAMRAAGFDMDVAYGARRKVEGAPWLHVPDVIELARRSEILVLCCPGGEGTRHLVGREVLAALGSSGILINVSRGTVVDEDALVAALDEGMISSAGLDVCENEPEPSPSLVNHPRVTLLPHIGSATVETRARMTDAMVAALCRELV